MTTGRVENRHALLSVAFALQGRPSVSIEFVVDTGFTDALCLPAPAVVALGLPFQFDFPASLADGSQVLLPVHEATILWNDSEQKVHVLATGNRPLIGTALLDGAELVIQFAEGGLVTVEPL
ncbi:MAG: clan AA aspartic protease [Fibrella sp.]|nr:clan AA aspartic protease [Armatimonadota bacterium]